MNDKSGGVEAKRLRAQHLEKDQAIEGLQRDLNAQKLVTEQYRASSEYWQNEHAQVTRKLLETRSQRNLAWGIAGLTALVVGVSGKRFRL